MKYITIGLIMLAFNCNAQTFKIKGGNSISFTDTLIEMSYKNGTNTKFTVDKTGMIGVSKTYSVPSDGTYKHSFIVIPSKKGKYVIKWTILDVLTSLPSIQLMQGIIE